MTQSKSIKSIKTEIQELTERFNQLEIYYKKESKSIKNRIRTLQQLLDIDEDSGFVTADKEETQEILQIPQVTHTYTTANYFNLNPLDIAIEKGVIVWVTNNYKSFFGLVGEVNRYSDTWVWFIDSSGKENKRIYKNLEVVAQNVKEYNKNRRFRKLIIPRRKK